MEGSVGLVGKTDKGSNDASGAIRRPNDVWVLPAARIKQILRGTFLENPDQRPIRSK